jgi:hypothetical protein
MKRRDLNQGKPSLRVRLIMWLVGKRPMAFNLKISIVDSFGHDVFLDEEAVFSHVSFCARNVNSTTRWVLKLEPWRKA